MKYTQKQILSNIAEIRKSKNLSQELIADEMKISQAQYARFERGATKSDLKTLLKFCDAVSIDFVDLVTYPDIYVNSKELGYERDPIEAVLQIKLQHDKKDQVLKLVFGEHNLEIFNNKRK